MSFGPKGITASALVAAANDYEAETIDEETLTRMVHQFVDTWNLQSIIQFTLLPHDQSAIPSVLQLRDPDSQAVIRSLWMLMGGLPVINVNVGSLSPKTLVIFLFSLAQSAKEHGKQTQTVALTANTYILDHCLDELNHAIGFLTGQVIDSEEYMKTIVEIINCLDLRRKAVRNIILRKGIHHVLYHVIARSVGVEHGQIYSSDVGYGSVFFIVEHYLVFVHDLLEDSFIHNNLIPCVDAVGQLVRQHADIRTILTYSKLLHLFTENMEVDKLFIKRMEEETAMSSGSSLLSDESVLGLRQSLRYSLVENTLDGTVFQSLITALASCAHVLLNLYAMRDYVTPGQLPVYTSASSIVFSCSSLLLLALSRSGHLPHELAVCHDICILASLYLSPRTIDQELHIGLDNQEAQEYVPVATNEEYQAACLIRICCDLADGKETKELTEVERTLPLNRFMSLSPRFYQFVGIKPDEITEENAKFYVKTIRPLNYPLQDLRKAHSEAMVTNSMSDLIPFKYYTYEDVAAEIHELVAQLPELSDTQSITHICYKYIGLFGTAGPFQTALYQNETNLPTLIWATAQVFTHLVQVYTVSSGSESPSSEEMLELISSNTFFLIIQFLKRLCVTAEHYLVLAETGILRTLLDILPHFALHYRTVMLEKELGVSSQVYPHSLYYVLYLLYQNMTLMPRRQLLRDALSTVRFIHSLPRLILLLMETEYQDLSPTTMMLAVDVMNELFMILTNIYWLFRHLSQARTLTFEERELDSLCQVVLDDVELHSLFLELVRVILRDLRISDIREHDSLLRLIPVVAEVAFASETLLAQLRADTAILTNVGRMLQSAYFSDESLEMSTYLVREPVQMDLPLSVALIDSLTALLSCYILLPDNQFQDYICCTTFTQKTAKILLQNRFCSSFSRQRHLMVYAYIYRQFPRCRELAGAVLWSYTRYFVTLSSLPYGLDNALAILQQSEESHALCIHLLIQLPLGLVHRTYADRGIYLLILKEHFIEDTGTSLESAFIGERGIACQKASEDEGHALEVMLLHLYGGRLWRTRPASLRESLHWLNTRIIDGKTMANQGLESLLGRSSQLSTSRAGRVSHLSASVLRVLHRFARAFLPRAVVHFNVTPIQNVLEHLLTRTAVLHFAHVFYLWFVSSSCNLLVNDFYRLLGWRGVYQRLIRATRRNDPTFLELPSYLLENIGVCSTYLLYLTQILESLFLTGGFSVESILHFSRLMHSPKSHHESMGSYINMAILYSYGLQTLRTIKRCCTVDVLQSLLASPEFCSIRFALVVAAICHPAIEPIQPDLVASLISRDIILDVRETAQEFLKAFFYETIPGLNIQTRHAGANCSLLYKFLVPILRVLDPEVLQVPIRPTIVGEATSSITLSDMVQTQYTQTLTRWLTAETAISTLLVRLYGSEFYLTEAIPCLLESSPSPQALDYLRKYLEKLPETLSTHWPIILRATRLHTTSYLPDCSIASVSLVTFKRLLLMRQTYTLCPNELKIWFKECQTLFLSTKVSMDSLHRWFLYLSEHCRRNGTSLRLLHYLTFLASPEMIEVLLNNKGSANLIYEDLSSEILSDNPDSITMATLMIALLAFRASDSAPTMPEGTRLVEYLVLLLTRVMSTQTLAIQLLRFVVLPIVCIHVALFLPAFVGAKEPSFSIDQPPLHLSRYSVLYQTVTLLLQDNETRTVITLLEILEILSQAVGKLDEIPTDSGYDCLSTFVAYSLIIVQWLRGHRSGFESHLSAIERPFLCNPRWCSLLRAGCIQPIVNTTKEMNSALSGYELEVVGGCLRVVHK
ncbi:hypothetical protein GMRT_11105 [Giardia muris]|uniref:Uncharacterized protein n=1 Tax=Giardia muris TaxID=5742 RepID=A0A4Z1SW80_GIAMU|nr:hypothetical protein GMRT_11105 [Giardia muris]|eukprot:TNJ30092.1 hypothetical protein GMRT_11105 [Giardia muris]